MNLILTPIGTTTPARRNAARACLLAYDTAVLREKQQHVAKADFDVLLRASWAVQAALAELETAAQLLGVATLAELRQVLA